MADLASVAASLSETTANLDAYIDRYAKEQAAERVAEAQATANAAIREACAELERERDLTAELRRRLEGWDKRLAEATEARTRIACALSILPHTHPWADLAAEVECRLAEQDATIERLRAQVLELTMAAQTDEVSLPEIPGPEPSSERVIARGTFIAPVETGEPWRGPAQADWEGSRDG